MENQTTLSEVRYRSCKQEEIKEDIEFEKYILSELMKLKQRLIYSNRHNFYDDTIEIVNNNIKRLEHEFSQNS